ncbi:MAG: nucleoside recognition domain-containing protein [Burkholderiales bacterium]|nr:nucleoside recognition domain-containing protein [Burkholderiales bacterium]
MALTYIWAGFFIVGFVAALIQWLFLGDAEVFKRIVDGTFDSARVGVMEIALPLAGVMTLWLGILTVGEKAGAIDFVAKLIAPFFSRIFPGVPKGHPATGLMVMNYSANFLGLDNAATPVGLKAMASLQELNPKKDEATDAQIMFLVLQTAGLTLIPLTVMAQRAVLGAKDPSDIFIPTLIATFAGTFVALIAVALRQRIRLLDPVIMVWLGSAVSIVVGIVWFMSTQMTKEEIQAVSKIAANFILLSVIVIFLVGALKKKVNVYEAFIEGAKGGIQTSITIIPYLVGMLVAISVLRNSGVLGMIVSGFAWFFGALGFNTDFTPALPTALMKSISGSGARAMMIEAMKTYGVDSFVGRLVSILQGSSDTTFYIIALYFGSVGITRTRYAITYGLLADVAGVTAAIWVAYLFFH